MAYGNPRPSDDDESMYADAAPAQQEAPKGEEEESSEPVATIPKALLAGKEFKPGEEIVFEIVSIQDDSVVIKYASEHGKEGEGYEEGERGGMAEGTMGGGDEYASMME